MAERDPIQVGLVIIGGGIAGLWTLREVLRRGHSAILIERTALGDGQTMWSQGIIHGGLKYTLGGKMSQSARAIREMPAKWRRCLAGHHEPDLIEAGVRAPHCHLWRTTSLRSRAGMIGARVGLHVAPVMLEENDRPEALRECPGAVARLDEIVVDPARVLEALAAPVREHLILGEADVLGGHALGSKGARIRLTPAGTDDHLTIDAAKLILCAGAGNAQLRERLSLSSRRMQTRPLHMIMVRGERLSELNGHCVDGARTRVTISSARDSAGRTVWQIGGEISERGVGVAPDMLIDHAKRELAAVIPKLDVSELEWATYRADRVEGRTPGRQRPEDVVIIEEGPVISAWPTKLALAPRIAEQIASKLGEPSESSTDLEGLGELPRPDIALPPWERMVEWVS